MSLKRVRNKYSISNYQELLEYLEEMKQDGWILKRINSYWLTFVEEKEEDDTKYLIDIFEQKYNLLRFNVKAEDEFLETYTMQGYEHIGSIDSLFIFRLNGIDEDISQPTLKEKIVKSIKYEMGNEIFGLLVFLFLFIFSFRLWKLEEIQKMYEMFLTYRRDLFLPFLWIAYGGFFSIYRLCRLKKVRNIYENSSKMDGIIPTTNFSYSIFNLIRIIVGIAVFVELLCICKYL